MQMPDQLSCFQLTLARIAPSRLVIGPFGTSQCLPIHLLRLCQFALINVEIVSDVDDTEV